ncbi:zinc ribbon domain-containing protein [Microvirgula aerodenitrificans]|uniref:zinc ribbon domain-containing protein n=1 Tax=Microvirgula aerodenitrificans TaxID=57480 RepID=UPI00248E2AD1|nr:zinc ribbon domain-containing protein [Microvirgula aerodenitrificans]
MRRFCTRCGHPDDDAARFCGQCGAPMKIKAPATPVAVRPWLNRRRVAGIAVALLVAGGAATWVLLPQSASEAVFAAAIDQSLAADRVAQRRTVCLGNFDYSRSPVNTSRFDSETNNWLAELVKAGLYQPPRELNGGLFSQFQYVQTETGRAAVRDGRLCVADGLRVEAVTAFTPPETLNGVLVTEASVRYRLDRPAVWLSEPIRRELFHGESGPGGKVALARIDGKWKVASASERQALSQALFIRELGAAGVDLAREEVQRRGLVAAVIHWFQQLLPSR